MPDRVEPNRLSARLGIDYPVIQGPLAGMSSHRLTAAVSKIASSRAYVAIRFA